jgi:signal transduction histidine kinase
LDIKWKNIAKNMKSFFSNGKRTIPGVLLILIGIIVLGVLLHEAKLYYISTRQVWKIGIIVNAVIGLGIWLTLPVLVKIIYQDWRPKNSDFYPEWKEQWKHQQRILLISCAILLFASMWFLNLQMNGGWYYSNFATGYLALVTTMIQFTVVEMVLIKFMRSRLDLLMECVNEVNKERLKEAVELEKQSIEKAAKSEQLKVDLISNVSHDLKTPLTSMVGYLELLKKEELADVPRDYVEVISDKAEKLKEMIESLFSIAKASSGNMDFNMESIEFNRLIEQILADMEDRIKKSDLSFVTLLTDEDTHMITDNIHMYRICQNLIENTLKYSARNTRVFVKTFIEKSLTEQRLCLEITNTAGYMMDFDKEDIVERFARGDKARSSEGNGLGLAIVSTYTGALGGSFDINIDCDQFKAMLYFPIEDENEAV